MSESEQSIASQSSKPASGHSWGTVLLMLLFTFSGLFSLRLLFLGDLYALAGADNKVLLMSAAALQVAAVVFAFLLVWSLYRLRRSALWWVLAYYLCAIAAAVLLLKALSDAAFFAVMVVVGVGWPTLVLVALFYLGLLAYLQSLQTRGRLH